MVLQALVGVVMAGGVAACMFAGAARSPQVTLPVHLARQSADDLEITGLPPQSSRYVGYAELTALPQVTAEINAGPDFGGLTMQVTGVDLDRLAAALGVPASADLIDALCTDRYRSYFPAEYRARHHPLLVLKVDGQRMAEWAEHTHQYDPGPYFIEYDNFVPAFHVLSHADEEQQPTNVMRLNFGSAVKEFAVLKPHESHAPDSPVGQGFVIAKQNCLRCHFSGEVGGTKSGVNWSVLSRLAREQPAFFAQYVSSPAAVAPQAHMPGNPQYDEVTLEALTGYFAAMTEVRR
ncbi:hypothetical protein FTO74_06075 [Granulicella sp. WH15]|uniref:hypothetical protein n=1 Tax=Granulicella sp. WH15 TaxID=2602070 RepID=UPI00136759FA|nr:hypothetical protein [Granulicella sp. WH15]QHN02984.1 hypothetical protein FTO74_06075 [Granulicella sp. WH15]